MIEAFLELLGSHDAWVLLVLCVATFLGSVLGGVSGFGAGLLIVPILAPIVGVKAIVPVMAVGMTIGNLSRVWVYRRAIDRAIVWRIGAVALPFTVLGCLVYDRVPAVGLAVVIGLFLLVSVPLRRVLARRAVPLGRAGVLAAGCVFGFVSGTVPGGGIILSPVLLGLGLFAGRLVGTDALVSVGVNLVRMTTFGVLALLTPELAVIGLLIGLCTIPGAFAARWMIERLSVRVHTIIVEIMVVIGGLSLLVEAWR